MDGLLSFEAASARVLTCLREQLPLGMWAITRRDGDGQVFVEVRDETFGITRGDIVSWEDSLCRRMVAGAQQLAPDTGAVAGYAQTVPVQQWPVGAYVGMPIRIKGGGLYGTLCGYHPHAMAAHEVARLGPVLELLADLLGQVLLSEQLREQARAREAELHRLATHDGLTGLATRAVFHDRLTHALDAHRSSGRAVTVLLVDLDDFKSVNDAHGHAAGDALLVKVATRWSAMVSPGHTLARLGGDEFALLVDDGTPLEQVEAIAEAVLGQVHDVAGTPRTVGISAGLVHLDAAATPATTAQVLAHADAAMYRAKHSGKHRITTHVNTTHVNTTHATDTADTSDPAATHTGPPPPSTPTADNHRRQVPAQSTGHDTPRPGVALPDGASPGPRSDRSGAVIDPVELVVT